jgi:hypothetical protein
MAIDLAALRAKLQAAAAANNITSNKENLNVPVPVVQKEDSTGMVNSTSGQLPVVLPSVPAVSEAVSVHAVVVSNTDVIGTAKTSEIDHLDFLNKMNLLQEAIHKQHPTMPVLLMQIHKQLRADPELTSTLSEEGIGVIVRGLQIQTKTELVSVVVKESKSKKNKTPISLDMF